MFCGMKKIVNCMNQNYAKGIVESTFNDIIEVRRFGLDQNQAQITYDDFGEPINLSSQQNYYSFLIRCKIEVEEERNDENSTVGGRVRDISKMDFGVSLDENLMLNDIVVYPPYSNQTYRVINDFPLINRFKRQIIAINDDKSTK